MMTLNMAYSDFFIYRSIEKLLKEKDESILYQEILDNCEMSCSLITVHRAVTRLENAGKIRRVSGGKGRSRGYKYELL